VAYLTGRTWRKKPLPPGQLPEPEEKDFALLKPACADAGVHLEVAYWDADRTELAAYDALLIRSCWDYVDRPAEFLETLARLEQAGLRVINPHAVVAWNARKTYLQDLANAGVPSIDTLWLDHVDAPAVARGFDTLDAAEIVLKPQVGSGSRDTIRLKRNAWSPADLIDGPPGAAMLQSFLPSLETEGEVSLFFCAGTLTHAILKRPPPGDWRANLMDCSITAYTPSPAQTDTAAAALAAAPKGLVYARVDLVLAAGAWKVIELELIEPRLYFTYVPSAAVPFARALAGVLRAA
jgi:glutathione synthase/RimK-type ligase-like ATP-grasp enzyme